MKEKEELVIGSFGWWFCIRKGGGLFGILWKIILLRKRRSTNKLDHVDFIVNYLKKMRMRGLRENIWVSIFQVSNLVLDRVLG